MSMNLLKCVLGLSLAATLAACGGGGGNASTPAPLITPTTPPIVVNSTVASIRINASSNVLNADGTSSVTFTVFALTGGNASVAGAIIDLAATNGVILSKPSALTTEAGATVTMIAVSSDQTNRVSTLTATCAACTASPATSAVKVVGASIGLGSSGALALVVGSPSTVLSATVKDVAGLTMAGVTVSFASTDAAIVGLSAPTAVTNNSGVATVAVSGLGTGSASINASALGNAKSQAYTSGAVTSVMSVTSPVNNFVLETNVDQPIAVSAPGASSVTFAATRGLFENGATSQTVAVVGDKAAATLKSSQAGTSTVSIVDNLKRTSSITLIVSPPVASVNKILLNASQTTLPVSLPSGALSSVTVTARAVLFDGATDQSVAKVPVEFSMSGGPGGGEFLSPALVFTDSAGFAVATFTAGSAASIPNGIVISAKVQGTSVRTGLSPSNNSVQLTIGGRALSVAFGPASVIGESADKTLYIQAYSVQVADANNNPVANQVVTLRMRPVAFSLGGACTVVSTYCSEDVNGNDSLEAAIEDGVRTPTTVATTGSCPSVAPAITGTADGNLTPQNSDGGSVPATVITGANGIAAFDLTYLKGSALWVVNKLTASVSSNGTETSKSTVFRLAMSVPDLGPPCALSPSPYNF